MTLTGGVIQTINGTVAPTTGEQGTEAYSGPRTWTNGSGDGLWTTGSNWAPMGVPGPGDVAHFDATSTDDCLIPDSPTVQPVDGIVLNPGYTGTVTQAMAIEPGALHVRSGTWDTAGFGITTEDIHVNGSSVFHARASTVRVERPSGVAEVDILAANFEPGTSTFLIGDAIVHNTVDFYQLTLLDNATVNVKYDLLIGGGITLGADSTLHSSVGPSTFKLDNAALVQGIGSTFQGSPHLIRWEFDNATFTEQDFGDTVVIFSGTPYAFTGNTFTAAELVVDVAVDTNGNDLTLTGLTINATTGELVLGDGVTLTVRGNITANGTVTAHANALILINGTGAQSISATATLPNVTVNKSSGTASLAAALTITGTLLVEAGTFALAGYPVTADRYEQTNGTLQGTNGEVTVREFSITGGSRTDTVSGVRTQFFLTGEGTISASEAVNTNLTLVFTNGCVTTIGSDILVNAGQILGFLFKTGSTVKTLESRMLTRSSGGPAGAPVASITAEPGAIFDLHADGGLTFRLNNSSHGVQGEFPGCVFVITVTAPEGIHLLGDMLCWDIAVNNGRKIVTNGYNLTVENNLTVSVADTEFNAADSVVRVGGNLTVDATSVYTSIAGHTLILNGTAAQSIALGGHTVGDVEVTNSTAAVTFTQAFTCANFTCNTPSASLAFQASETFTITGTLTINEGTLVLGDGGTLVAHGSVTANGTVTAHANSTLLFTGTATQAYTGTATWGKTTLNKTGGEVVQASDFRCAGEWTVQAGETTRRWDTAGFDLHCGSLLVPDDTRAITLTGATWIRCAGDFDVGSISGGDIFTGTLRLEHGGGICRYAQVDGRITNYVAKANATVIPRTMRVDGTAHFEDNVLVTTADGTLGIVRLYGATAVTTGVGVVFQKGGTELFLIYIEGTVSFDFADFNNCQIRVPTNVGYEMQGDLITTDDFVPEGGNQGANSIYTNGHALTCGSIRLGGSGPTAGSWLYVENGSTVACSSIFQNNNGRRTNHINVDATSLLRVRGNITLLADWGSLNADQVNQPGWLVENLELYDNANQTVSIETDRRTENVTVNKTGGTLTYSKAHDFDTFLCNTPGQALTFQAGATFEVGTLTITGAVGNLVSIDRDGGAGTDQTSIDAAVAAVDYASIANVNALTPITVTNSTDGGNNTGLTF